MTAATRVDGQRDRARPVASRRTDAVTLALTTWMAIGGFVDGWAHRDLAVPESFFTPWHALLYSGFTASAAWIAWQALRFQEPGQWRRAAIPAGYGLGLVGVSVFAFGGVADLAWHTVFGIETSLDALLSPPHLVLMVGGMLMVSIPLRAAWAVADDRAASLGSFALPLLSAGLVMADISFFTMYFSAFVELSPAVTEAGWNLGSQASWNLSNGSYPGAEFIALQGIGAAFITNLVLLTPVLHLLRRWRPPFGAVTVLFTFVALMATSLSGFATAVTVLPAVIGGLAADALCARLRPSPERPVAFAVFATATPLAFWSAYYLTLAAAFGSAWAIELPLGLVILNSLAGFGLSRLLRAPEGVVRITG